MAWLRRDRPLGARAEAAAARYLKRHGYRILARNLRTPAGEIDLLAEDRDDDCIAVVEVKAGAGEHPPPEVHVNHRKRQQLVRLARQVVRRFKLDDRRVRFDVVGIVWPDGERRPTRLTHHVNAFRADGR